MASQLFQYSKMGSGSTSGVAAANTAVISLLTDFPTLDNCVLYFEGVCVGRTAAGNCVVMTTRRSCKMQAGALSGLAIADILQNVASGALIGCLCDIDLSGTDARLRPTGVAAQDITWTGYLTVWSSPF